MKHTHDMDLVTADRPSLWMLIWLGIAGGLLPDPLALTLLLRAIAEGKVMLGLGVVLVFSIGFAAVLVAVGVVAAAVGRRVLDWLAGPWAARLQIGTLGGDRRGRRGLTVAMAIQADGGACDERGLSAGCMSQSLESVLPLDGDWGEGGTQERNHNLNPAGEV